MNFWPEVVQVIQIVQLEKKNLYFVFSRASRNTDFRDTKDQCNSKIAYYELSYRDSKKNVYLRVSALTLYCQCILNFLEHMYCVPTKSVLKEAMCNEALM